MIYCGIGFGRGSAVMGLTHVLFGLFLFLLFWRFGLIGFDESLSGVVLGVLLIGSVLPDLDHPVGLLYSLFGVPRWLRRGVGRMVGQRGFLHTVWVAVVVLVLGYLIFGVVLGFGFWGGVGLFVGYFGHLVLDSLTVRGVAWLSPLSRRRVWFVVGTGGMVERVFFYLLALVSVVVGYPLFTQVFEFIDLKKVFGSFYCTEILNVT